MKKLILGITIIGIITSCQQDEIEPTPTSETVTDIDGNEYNTVVIGTQEWMAENLRTTKYCNGDPIPNVTDETQWVDLTIGAWARYDNDNQNENLYGKLYNWFAVDDEKNICPCGWHVPSNTEWTVLTNYLGGENVAGGKIKSTGTQYWWTPNGDATNVSGFTGLPGGLRHYTGLFYEVGAQGFWWSSTEDRTDDAWYRYLDRLDGSVYVGITDKVFGMSVRCIRD